MKQTEALDILKLGYNTFLTGPPGSGKTFLLNKYIEYLKKNNIELRIGNFMEDDIDYSKIDLILIDVDPHDGLQEPPMIEYLVNIGWEGLLLLDDIMFAQYPVMQKMWYNLPYEKYDITEVGHYSGTGLLNIGNKFELQFIAE